MCEMIVYRLNIIFNVFISLVEDFLWFGLYSNVI